MKKLLLLVALASMCFSNNEICLKNETDKTYCIYGYSYTYNKAINLLVANIKDDELVKCVCP